MKSPPRRREVELREEGHGARRLGLGEEAEQAEHREPAVVDLGVAALGQLLGRLLAGAEAPVEVRERALEVGVLARQAAAHVVRVALARRLVGLELAPELEAADEADDLPLAAGLEVVPERRDASVAELGPLRRPTSSSGEAPGDALGWTRSHGSRRVLDLGLAQEADRRLVALLPEVLVAELERVEVAHDRVLLLGERRRVFVRQVRRRVVALLPGSASPSARPRPTAWLLSPAPLRRAFKSA